MPTDYELAEGDKFASVIYIIGAVLAIFTADKAQQMLVQQKSKGETSSVPNPARHNRP
jgi:hypothetical protein